MNSFGRTLSVLFALALLAALGIGGYFAVNYVVALFLDLDVQVARVTAIASVVLLLAATIIAGSFRQAITQSRKNQLQADKAATYTLFINTWNSLLRDRAESAQQSTIALSEAFPVLNQSLALYGSPTVIKAHVTLRTLAAESGTQNPEIMRQFSKALLELRKDLGSDSQGLTAEMVHDLYTSEVGGAEVSGMAEYKGTAPGSLHIRTRAGEGTP